MQFLRKFFLFIISAGLLFTLFTAGTMWTVRYTVMDRNEVQSWLRDSKVYDNFINQVAAQFEKEQAKQQTDGSNGEGERKIDTAAIIAAAKVALPPETLQTNVEKVLNSSYDWLEKKTTVLVFNLDLTEAKQKFADALGDQALTRLAALPPCPGGAIPPDFDPFSATCMPSSAAVTAEINKIKSEVATSQEILPDTQITQDDVKLESDGTQKSISETYKNIPKYYGYVALTPLAFSLLALIGIGFVFLLKRPVRSAPKLLAILFGIPAICFLMLAAAGSVLNNQLGELIIPKVQDKGVAETLVVPFAKQVNASFVSAHFVIGLIYLVVCLFFVVLAVLLKPKKTEAKPELKDSKPPVDDSPKKPEEKPAPAKKTAVKVQ